MIEIKIVGGVPRFEVLVGHRFIFEDKKIRIYEYDGNTGSLKLAIDIHGNGIDEVTEEITASLGLDRFISSLRENYGLDVVLVEGFSYSIETIQKARGLVLAGFNKLIKAEDNYMVDNIFQQTFLIEDELQYLLENNVLEINLSEIK